MLSIFRTSPRNFGFRRMLPVAVLPALILMLVGLALAREEAVMARLVEKSLLLDGHAVAGLSVIVGERGHILRSLDGGRSWKQAKVATRATLTGVHLHDADLGWAVGHDQVILRTRDGGESWQMLYSDVAAESPLLDVWFADDRHGYAVGAYGYFLETRDGGETWQGRRIAESDYHLNKIIHVGGSRLFIAGEAGTLLRSEDLGATWEALSSPYEGSFFGALALSEEALLVFGLRGHLFRSDDAGRTWKELTTGTESSLNDGMVLPDGTLVIAGLAGTLLTSHDQGLTFSAHQQEDRKGFSALVTSVDSTLVAAGEFGVKHLPLQTLLVVK